MSLTVIQFNGELVRMVSTAGYSHPSRIGFYAFHYIISQKKDPNWNEIVGVLKSMVNSRRYKHARSKRSPIVRRVQASMTHVIF